MDAILASILAIVVTCLEHKVTLAFCVPIAVDVGYFGLWISRKKMEVRFCAQKFVMSVICCLIEFGSRPVGRLYLYGIAAIGAIGIICIIVQVGSAVQEAEIAWEENHTVRPPRIEVSPPEISQVETEMTVPQSEDKSSFVIHMPDGPNMLGTVI